MPEPKQPLQPKPKPRRAPYPWPPRRAQAPVQPQPQQSLPLEPSAEEVLAEVERIRLGRAFWRRRFASLEALLADPQRRHVMTVCARQALIARARAQRR